MNNTDKFNPLAWANQADGTKPREEEKVQQTTTVDDLQQQKDDVESLAREIVSRRIDITQGYDRWLSLGFAIVDGFGEDGRSIFHDLSRMNKDYNPEECDKQYNKCLNGKKQGITIRTFFQMAKDAGISLGEFARQKVSATYAIMPNGINSKKVVKSTVLGTFNNEMADGSLAEVAEEAKIRGNGYTFSDKLNIEDLTSILRTVFDLHRAEPAKCDAQLIGTLNAIGGLMGGTNGTTDMRSGIYGIYDGRRIYAPTYNIVYSGAGNDKGNLVFCKYLLHAVKREMRCRYEAEKSEYDAEVARWEAQDKKNRGEAPKEPVYRDPFVPGNSSSSAVYRAIDANGGWGMMFETEADTISSMIDSDYGNYSDLMRKAHHHESLSMNRVTEKIHIDIDEPRLSIFLTCTPGQLPALFPSFENGLGSRFLFYNTPDEQVSFHNVFALKETPLEDIYKKLGEELMPLYHAMQMRAGHPIQFVLSQTQQQEFLETYSGILSEQFRMLGKGIRAFIFRMALECFRYAMILTTLRRLNDWQDMCRASEQVLPSIFKDDENALVCDNRDFNIAMTIMGCLINHTARVYAVMAKEDDNPFAQKGIQLTSDELQMYNAMPYGDFHTADFIDKASGLNISERTAHRMLSQLCNVYRIINPVRRGIYNKPQLEND